MIIESGYLYRDIASQSEFSFNIVLENSTVTGISKFGFIDYTGKEENFFIFKSGKILDLNNNIFDHHSNNNVIHRSIVNQRNKSIPWKGFYSPQQLSSKPQAK